MSDRSSPRAAHVPVEEQEDPAGDAFQLMAQGLAQLQVANGRLHIALQQQEQKMIEALQQQDQRSQDAVREVLQLQEQGLQERINEVKQVMEGKIARVSEAVCNLTLAVNEGLKRVGEKIETLESSSLERECSKDKKGQDALEQLESRMKNLEASVQRALKCVFPRVDALVSQLEHHEHAVTSQNSVSVDIPPTSTASSSGSGSLHSSSAAFSPSTPVTSHPLTSEPSTPVASHPLTSEPSAPVTSHPLTSEPSTSVTSHPLTSEPSTPVTSHPLTSEPSTSVTPSSPSATAQSDVDQEQRISLGRDLCKAAEDGKVEEVQRLLSLGAIADFSDADGWTPLHWAARNACVKIVALLLYHGADVHARDTDGDTPLHLAALYDRVGQCVYLLLDAGACTDSTDKNGETPLGWAYNAGNAAAMRFLEAAIEKSRYCS